MLSFKSAAVAALSVVGLAVLSACNAEEPAKNVAVVNGVPIPQARMDLILKMQQGKGQKDSEEMRTQLREALITREILAQEAVKKGFDQSEELRTQLDMTREQFLVNAFLTDYLKTHNPTDAELQAEYEAVKKEQYDPNAKEYKARHILIKPAKDDPKAVAAAKQKAEGLLAQLKKGAKFEDLAKKYSDDPGSKGRGGELDWTDGTDLVAPFVAGMKALNKGETSKTLVKTQFGFHIIRVDDVRPVEFPTFEQVKDKVAEQLIGKQRDQLIEELRKSAKVE